MSEAGGSWLVRLKDGLGRTSSRLVDGISAVFTKRRLDEAAMEQLEELLISADLGVATAARLTQTLAKTRFGKEVGGEEVRQTFAQEIARILEPVAKPLRLDDQPRPQVILVCGVNGSGKTTTIGKLAKQFRDDGKSVMLVAGDTFRAAAVQQLKVWATRADCRVVAGEAGADAAGLCFDALKRAAEEQVDLVIIDTAGRLQNKAGLMEELKKITRVIGKLDESAPHACLLVLDATVGQNAHSQLEVFRDMVAVNGLVMTKLDGTAKGGVVVALAERFGLPVHAVGVGEGIDDLRPFKADDFARSLMGLDP